MREEVPEEIRQARAVVRDREELLAKAKAQAGEILARGRQEQLRLAEHEEVVRRAHEEAARILSEGQTAVRELRREADAYADERLREVADALRAALEVVGRTETGLSQGLAQAELGRERLGVPFDTPAEATVPSGPFDEEMRP